MNDEATIKSVATMLSAAYWHGRLESLIMEGGHRRPMIIEDIIVAAVKADRDNWIASARTAVTKE